MKTSGSLSLLAAAVALACGCDGSHVLGTANAGSTGQMNTTSGAAGGSAGAVVTMGPGASGTAATTGDAGVTTGATGGFPGKSDAGPSTGPGTTGAGGTSGTKSTVIAGPLGPSQSWTGYVEQFTLPSGSDVLKLTFATDANGIAKGTIVFGEGTPPPPATDPNIGYPPDWEARATKSGTDPLFSAFMYLAEGFSYAFDGGTLDAHRLRFVVDTNQLWSGWCALQKPATDPSSSCFPLQGGSFGDTGCWQTNPVTGQMVKEDCGKYYLCIGPPCSCSDTACGLDADRPSNQSFDVFISGDTLSGSVTGGGFNSGGNNVHFVKD
jgi:hypothetical protein